MHLLSLKKTQTTDKDLTNTIINCEKFYKLSRDSIQSGVSLEHMLLSAGQALSNATHQNFSTYKVLVLCGPGKNGVTGIIAGRFLSELGHDCYIIKPKKYKQKRAKTIKTLYKSNTHPIYTSIEKSPLAMTQDNIVVIDALFGTGYNGNPLTSDIDKLYTQIKDQKCPVIAVDVPSGMNADTGTYDKNTLPATMTVTFHSKKNAHEIDEAIDICGKISVHDIGLL